MNSGLQKINPGVRASPEKSGQLVVLLIIIKYPPYLFLCFLFVSLLIVHYLFIMAKGIIRKLSLMIMTKFLWYIFLLYNKYRWCAKVLCYYFKVCQLSIQLCVNVIVIWVASIASFPYIYYIDCFTLWIHWSFPFVNTCTSDSLWISLFM